MRKPSNYIGVLLLLLIAIACNKDKLNTRPTIKVKDVRNRFVPTGTGTQLQVEFDYADKEGDVANTMFIQKIRLNKFVREVKADPDTFSLRIPDLGLDKPDGQIEIHLINSELEMARFVDPNAPEPDTIMIRFALRDKAGNVSDTVEVTPVFVQR